MVAPSPGGVKRFIGGPAVTGVLVMTAASSILAQAGATGQITCQTASGLALNNGFSRDPATGTAERNQTRRRWRSWRGR
jgi:hypothetical protein